MWNVYANNISGNGSSITSVNAIALGGVSLSTLNTTITSNAATAYANAVANAVANTSQAYANATNGLAINGTSNNASYLGGVVSTSYVNTSGAYTISGVHTHNANVSIAAGSILQWNGGDVGISRSSAATLSLGNGTQNDSTGTLNLAKIFATGSANIGLSAFVANTTQVAITGVPLSANGGVGTTGQILTSNGATGSPYWSNILTSGTTINYGAGAFSVGYRDIPQNIQNANYTTSLTDAGGHIFNSTNATSLTYTIANNATASYANGAAISIINGNTATITIAGGTGVTLQLAGSTTT